MNNNPDRPRFAPPTTIGRDGIKLHDIRYNSHALQDLARRINLNEKVKVRFDPRDLRTVHVFDRYMGCWIAVSFSSV